MASQWQPESFSQVERSIAAVVLPGRLLIAALAGQISLLIGAWVLMGLGWPWVFAVNLPVVALGVLLGLKVLPTTLTHKARRLDRTSALQSTLGLTLSLGALLQGPPVQGWRSPGIWAALATGLLLVVGFINRQRRLNTPLLQLQAWHQAPVRQALLGLFAMTIAFNGAQSLAVLRLHQASWSPLAIGSLLAPYALVVWLSSRGAAQWARSLGGPHLIRLAFVPSVGVAVLDALVAGTARYDISGLGGAALISGCLLLERVLQPRSVQHEC